jgi:DNA-binding SARP family transcriptional activator/DNA-binding NarL/FixJ family response regulator
VRSTGGASTSPGIQIGLLGPFQLAVCGQAVALGPRAKSLLAMLALRAGAPVTCDRLIDGLWGDDPPPSARNTLQTHVTHLRQALEPHRRRRAEPERLLTVGDAYLLAVEPDAVDVRRFEALVRAGAQASTAPQRLDRAEQALASWRGDPLADVSAAGIVDFERTRLHELRRQARHLHADALSELGRHAEAVVGAEDLLRDHPYDECAWALLMRALYRAGRPAQALDAYQRARRLLRDELGLDPSPELRALEARVLAHDDQLTVPATVVGRPSVERPTGASAGDPTAARPPALRVVIADDSLVVREGLQRLVELDDGVAVVAVCGSFDELLEATEHHRPDVVLTDIRMPPAYRDEGVRVAQELRSRQPGVGVVVLSQFAEPAYALAVLRDGAGRRGYLLKESVRRPSQLHEAIHAVAAGGSALDPAVVDLLVAERSVVVEPAVAIGQAS